MILGDLQPITDGGFLASFESSERLEGVSKSDRKFTNFVRLLRLESTELPLSFVVAIKVDFPGFDFIFFQDFFFNDFFLAK